MYRSKSSLPSRVTSHAPSQLNDWSVSFKWPLKIFLYRGDMQTCLRVLTAGQIPNMSELLHGSEPSFERGPHNLKTPSAARCCVPLGNDHPLINGSAPAERYHTLNTTVSRFWAGMVFHWTVYIGHWQMLICVEETWKHVVHWQQRCRDACQILERCEHFNIQPRGFESSRDVTVRRLTT